MRILTFSIPEGNNLLALLPQAYVTSDDFGSPTCRVGHIHFYYYHLIFVGGLIIHRRYLPPSSQCFSADMVCYIVKPV